MAKPFEGFTQRSTEHLISVSSVGFFLILIGMIFALTPDFFSALLTFFKDLGLVQVPNVYSGIVLPAPKNPADHTTVYSAASWFSFGWGIFLVALLIVRILVSSPLKKKAQNASDIFYWLANGFLIGHFLNETTTTLMWFSYWSALILLLGVSLIIRALILAFFYLIR
jgi:hypothetical protein